MDAPGTVHLTLPIVCFNLSAAARPGVEKNPSAPGRQAKNFGKNRANSSSQAEKELIRTASLPYPFKQMEEEHSKLWRLALVLSLIAFVAAAYFRIPPVRDYINEKFPWVKQQLAERGIKIVDDPSEAFAAPSPVESAAPTRKPAPTPVEKPAISFEQIEANPALWPKEVSLKKQTVFPAVVEGKEVGKVTVSAGTAVQLYRIANQKLAVVYNGGGAWVLPAETDLLERVSATHSTR